MFLSLVAFVLVSKKSLFSLPVLDFLDKENVEYFFPCYIKDQTGFKITGISTVSPRGRGNVSG